MTAVRIASDVLFIAGGLWMVLAAIGVLRFFDVIARMHAATKATTLGLLFFLAGAALRLGPGDAVKLLLVAPLVFLTAPVAAHLVARAAHQVPGSTHLRIDTVDELERPES